VTQPPTSATPGLLVRPRPGEIALAIDIGGTKLAVGLVDDQGVVYARRQAPTTGGDGEVLFDNLAALVCASLDEGVEAGLVPTTCGVGCGGPMEDHGTTVTPINIPQWQAFPLADRLAALTGLDTHVDNDAKALTLAEGWIGAAAGASNFIGMVVSTGVGGGVVLDGRLLDGAAGNAGHIGHVIVEPAGHRCGCGAVGCLEAEASGTAIARITGRPAAEAGPDEMVRVGTLVGRAVASVANLLDLRLAVVAGSVALGFGAPFFAAAQTELDRRARLAFAAGARIVPAGLGGDAPLVGAAAVAWHRPGGNEARRPPDPTVTGDAGRQP
jgi:glucokinase